MTRFPASDPGKAEEIKVGYGPRAVAIDSLGNAWVANTVGHPSTRKMLALVRSKIKGQAESLLERSTPREEQIAKMWIGLFELVTKYPGGDISMIKPDGTAMPPFDGGKASSDPGES